MIQYVGLDMHPPPPLTEVAYSIFVEAAALST
jgi:hypothetical protein